MIKNDILIVQYGDVFPEPLRESLRVRGYTTQLMDNIDDALRTFRSFKRPVLLAYCGSADGGTTRGLEELLAARALITCPLIMVGPRPEQWHQPLVAGLPRAAVIKAPLTNSELFGVLDAIGRDYERYRISQKVEPTPLAPPVAVEAAPEPTAPESLEHKLYKGIVSIPEIYFDQLQKLSLSASKLGGLEYVRCHDEKRSKAGLPERCVPEVRATIATIRADAGKWARLHLDRTALLTKQILLGLRQSEEAMNRAQSTAYLLAWSFAGNDVEFLRREYGDGRSGQLRTELCSRIKDSAMKVALELKDTLISNTIVRVGKVIGREIAIDDDPETILASAIVAGDLADRVCFQSGFFNPRKGYYLLKRLRSGFYKELHPVVLCALVKIVSEAITARSDNFIVPNKVKKNKDWFAKLVAYQHTPVADNEKKVPLTELSPGMKLSRALTTFDGRELLGPELTLDQDLIWRIWQLSAVRPVNLPIVFKKSGQGLRN